MLMMMLYRNYLELMVELPWSKMTEDKLDISQARSDAAQILTVHINCTSHMN